MSDNRGQWGLPDWVEERRSQRSTSADARATDAARQVNARTRIALGFLIAFGAALGMLFAAALHADWLAVILFVAFIAGCVLFFVGVAGLPESTGPSEWTILPLKRETREWTSNIVVREYTNDESGRSKLEEEATVLAGRGYRIAGQSADGGQFKAGTFLVGGVAG